jgi:hypothetical protein
MTFAPREVEIYNKPTTLNQNNHVNHNSITLTKKWGTTEKYTGSRTRLYRSWGTRTEPIPKLLRSGLPGKGLLNSILCCCHLLCEIRYSQCRRCEFGGTGSSLWSSKPRFIFPLDSLNAVVPCLAIQMIPTVPPGSGLDVSQKSQGQQTRTSQGVHKFHGHTLPQSNVGMGKKTEPNGGF